MQCTKSFLLFVLFKKYLLESGVSQQLVSDVNKKLVPVFEIMTITPAIRNIIRDNKVSQIEGVVYGSDTDDIISVDNSLVRLVRQEIIPRKRHWGMR